MKIIRILSVFLVVCIFSPFCIYASGIGSYDDSLQAIASSGVSAQSAVLICANTHEVIYNKNEDAHLPIASTTKIMTAILTIENADLDKIVSVDADACGIEGSSIYLYEGEKISVKDLLYAVMLQSANDASAALAIEIAGSTEEFAEMMNAKAYELGMSDTNFTNPHGLDNEEHYSSAHDMAILTCYALSNETFREVTSTYKYTSEMNGGKEKRVFVNHNRLLKTYEGATGGKTGYTKRSGRCLVSSASRDGVELVCVTLNDPNDWRDHADLLDAGFEAYESVDLVSEGQYYYDIPVINGEEPSIRAEADPLTCIVAKGKSDKIETRCELPRFTYAPSEEDEKLGSLVFILDGKEIGRTPIKAKSSVENIKYKTNFFLRILSIFKKD